MAYEKASKNQARKKQYVKITTLLVFKTKMNSLNNLTD